MFRLVPKTDGVKWWSVGECFETDDMDSKDEHVQFDDVIWRTGYKSQPGGVVTKDYDDDMGWARHQSLVPNCLLMTNLKMVYLAILLRLTNDFYGERV